MILAVLMYFTLVAVLIWFTEHTKSGRKLMTKILKKFLH